MNVVDLLAVALLFGGGTLFLLAISPIGRALAERIRGGGGRGGATPAELRLHEDAMLEELEQLRQEVGELAERVDFVERLQAPKRDAERLAGSD